MNRPPRTSFPGIISSAWEHPKDKAALSVLRNIPGIDQALKGLGGFTSDRSLRLLFLGSAVRVSQLQFPRVQSALVEGCRILDLPVPELFITNDPSMNAMAIGVNKPFIVLHSALANSLDDDELLVVIGHELGHIKAGHALYHTILWILVNISFQLFPLDDLVKLPIVLALKDWERKAELSSDRAGLLCVQDPAVNYRAILKVISGGKPEEADLEELFRQAEEYEKGGDLMDSVFKFLNVMNSSHPLWISRLLELKKWADSPAYADILAGRYRRFGEDTPPDENIKEAWQTWKDDLSKSPDPGAKMATKLVAQAEQVAKELGTMFGNLLK